MPRKFRKKPRILWRPLVKMFEKQLLVESERYWRERLSEKTLHEEEVEFCLPDEFTLIAAIIGQAFEDSRATTAKWNQRLPTPADKADAIAFMADDRIGVYADMLGVPVARVRELAALVIGHAEAGDIKLAA